MMSKGYRTIFLQYDSREMACAALAGAVHAGLAAAITARGAASVALAGGTTPGPMFEMLSGQELAWDKVSVAPSDERCVPEDNPRSNARLLRETLLKDRAAAARLVPLAPGGEAPGPEGPAGLSAMLPLDILVLGMGEDMHTASLFPGADNLAAALSPDAPPVLAISAPGAPEPRVTLTAPVLTGAAEIHLLFFGAAKRAAYETALQDGPVEEAPVRALLRSGATIRIHYAD